MTSMSLDNQKREQEITGAFAQVLGYAPVTLSERKKWDKAVTELRIAGASPDAVIQRTKAWQKRYPEMPCNPWIVAEHWGELGVPVKGVPSGFIPSMGWAKVIEGRPSR